MTIRGLNVHTVSLISHSLLVACLVVVLALFDIRELYWLYVLAALAIAANVIHAKLVQAQGVVAITIPLAMIGYILLANDVAKVAEIRAQQQKMYQTLLESYQYSYTHKTKRKTLLPYQAIMPIIQLDTNTSRGWALLTEKNKHYRNESFWYLNGGQRTLYLVWLYENLGTTPEQEECLFDSLGTLQRDLIIERTSLNLAQWLTSDMCYIDNLLVNDVAVMTHKASYEEM